ncbi:MAG: BrnA antitoxin family protein [Gemmatimonadales bacterium]
MSAKRTGRVSKVAERPSQGRADLERLRAMTEEEIEASTPPEFADLPDDYWDDAVLTPPVVKAPISIRVDEDVLNWFRSLGPRYQTRMNAVLRSYMEHATPKRRPGRRKSGAA